MCLWTHLREIPRSGWQGQRVRASVTVKAAAVLPSTEAWRLTPQSGLRRRTGTGRGPSPAPSPHCRQGAHIPPVGRAGLGRGGRSLASQSWREVLRFHLGELGYGEKGLSVGPVHLHCPASGCEVSGHCAQSKRCPYQKSEPPPGPWEVGPAVLTFGGCSAHC